MKEFDSIIIGGGHAGIEAANAVAKMGLNAAMVTMDVNAIGRMSCNPAIGGVAKGQLVRDIDALGGVMGQLSDKAGIQFRMLNRSKGPAVWGPRAQMDMELYADLAQAHLKKFPNLQLISAEISQLLPLHSGFELKLQDSTFLKSKTIIITTGTFLGAVMYTGLSPVKGGRIGEAPANDLAKSIHDLGLKTRRLKTGTPARLDKNSIDFSKTIIQPGDKDPFPFSFQTDFPLKNDMVCWISHTNQKTHEFLREGFSQSPMFTGKIEGIGPRYCPSIEDKIDRFSDKESHQLFLEPEGVLNNRIYVNGFSSSLPGEIQERALKTIPGLENCKIIRYGYAVEYDAIDATQLHHTYETKDTPGLYLAGQVCGTSGYEEAAAQGLIAGINAALRVKNQEPFLISRAESYIGVLTDDLISMESSEPYRMFTSRAEYRLHLRQDNAELRLMEKGKRLGLIDYKIFRKFENFKSALKDLQSSLHETRISAKEISQIIGKNQLKPIKEGERAVKVLKRPGVSIPDLMPYLGKESSIKLKDYLALESEIKYSGFFERQEKDIERTKKLSQLKIPENFDFLKAKSMSIESRQKLSTFRPLTVGAAAKISGVTPADISGLIFHLGR